MFHGYALTYKDTIYRVALNYCGSPQDADDIVQEALLRLYTCRTEFESEDHVRRWLIRVTLNLCKNTMRWYVRRQHVPLEDVADSIRQQEQSDLFLAVMALPKKYRIVLYLFYYEEYTTREIAQLLNITVSSTTTRLSRARRLLRSQLTEVDADEN
ncbi:sigma-70 family RNA polymerase sigma factor [Anaerolentibacter hominis]|uniref:RNA polymerase sigma factor n=1 Tax=Anaerolentibacter hominis TaxID=3079009 RepID=UPI0031B87B41